MKGVMLFLCLQLLFFNGVAQNLQINRVIIREGQKLFLERSDYLNDKIYAITDKIDTVEVILADQAFYKFKKGDLYVWALTSQLRDDDILSNEYVGSEPKSAVTDRPTSVFKEGIMGSDQIFELKPNVSVKIIRRTGLFYEIEFERGQVGFIVTTSIPGPERIISRPHVIREAKAGTTYGSGNGPVSGNTVQCSGSTKKGTRCKNMTTNSNGRCYLH